jgi:hypothetical protein
LSTNNTNSLSSLCRLTRFRLFYFPTILVLLLGGLLASTASAQFKFRKPPNRQDPDALSAFDEQRIWDQFLASRALGRFTLKGLLVYRPARSKSTTLAMRLSGDWTPSEQVTGILLIDQQGNETDRTIKLSKGLPVNEDSCADSAPDSVDPTSTLVDSLPFTWDDILMPFLQWANITYLGPDRYIGRPAHRFALVNDEAGALPAKVIVTLDEDFAAMLKAELLNENDKIYKRIRIGGFKQYSSGWIFSELYWEDRVKRESVRLEVDDFEILQ